MLKDLILSYMVFSYIILYHIILYYMISSHIVDDRDTPAGAPLAPSPPRLSTSAPRGQAPRAAHGHRAGGALDAHLQHVGLWVEAQQRAGHAGPQIKRPRS